jgi:hypothetical protein
MTAPTDDPRALVDTNVVVYAYDPDDSRKHDITLSRVFLRGSSGTRPARDRLGA